MEMAQAIAIINKFNTMEGLIMDNPTGDPKALFDAIVTVTEMYQLADSYDDTDYSDGHNIPTPEQVAAGAAILAKWRSFSISMGRYRGAKAARRKLRELGYN